MGNHFWLDRNTEDNNKVLWTFIHQEMRESKPERSRQKEIVKRTEPSEIGQSTEKDQWKQKLIPRKDRQIDKPDMNKKGCKIQHC